MIYFNWLELVRSLLRDDQEVGNQLPDTHRQSLKFIAHLFQEGSPKVIRILDPTPRSFNQKSPILGSRPELFNESFRLPSPTTVVEDKFSAIAYNDVEEETTGVNRTRIYVHVERASPFGGISKRERRIAESAQDSSKDPSAEELLVMWGTLTPQGRMRLDGVGTPVALGPFGVMTIQYNQIVSLKLTVDFRKMVSLPHEGEEYQQEESEIAEELNICGVKLVQNLQLGILQIAYTNGLQETADD